MKRYIRVQAASSANHKFDKIKNAVDQRVLEYYMRGGCSEEECRKYFKVKIETTPNWYDDGTDMHLLTVYLDAIEPDSYESDHLSDSLKSELEFWKKYYEEHPEALEDLEDIDDTEEEPVIYGNVDELQYDYLDPLVKKFSRDYYFEKENAYTLICNLDW